MREVAGALFAAPKVLLLGRAAARAGAAGGTSCQTATGSATVTPRLLKFDRKALVSSTVRSTGAKIGGAGMTNATGPLTWNTKQTSTIALTLAGCTGTAATHARLVGAGTAGVLKGFRLSGSGISSIPAGACQKTALSKVTFKQLTALVIN